MKEDKKVSIVVATLERQKQLDRLLNSIVNSSYKNVEVIIVDQNPKGYLHDIISKYNTTLSLIHIISTEHGVSLNKNIGFHKSTGDIINYSDDDSFFDINTIEYGVALLENWDAVSGKVWCPLIGKSSLLKFPDKEERISFVNFYYTTIEFSMFWKRSIIEDIGDWDIHLGVGGVWGSEGGADLLVRSLKKGVRMYYFPDLKFYHENQELKDPNKLFSYGRGHGAMLAKNLLFEKNFRIIPYSFFYFFGAFVKSFIVFNIETRTSYKNRVKGIIEGFKEYIVFRKK